MCSGLEWAPSSRYFTDANSAQQAPASAGNQRASIGPAVTPNADSGHEGVSELAYSADGMPMSSTGAASSAEVAAAGGHGRLSNGALVDQVM